ncbi:hypothetical protein HHK36_008399 [Tetracentron sinense]|uniref:FAD-binding domain-containing protein n=1 Tax=Tetracentron sinense TaxID=13715 RepID=A0A834ZJF9_TETSI|nr:hypothetical protein HHK36_008399 [Tetracentron sinense]
MRGVLRQRQHTKAQRASQISLTSKLEDYLRFRADSGKRKAQSILGTLQPQAISGEGTRKVSVEPGGGSKETEQEAYTLDSSNLKEKSMEVKANNQYPEKSLNFSVDQAVVSGEFHEQPVCFAEARMGSGAQTQGSIGVQGYSSQTSPPLAARRQDTDTSLLHFPVQERGLPVTRVISRMTLQQIFARAVGEDVIMNASNVVNFEDDGNKVTVMLENGEHYEGDLLVGADGIWSKVVPKGRSINGIVLPFPIFGVEYILGGTRQMVTCPVAPLVRKNLFGSEEASYSGYTCYTGIADFVPPDIESVGYRIFLGHKQYFVSSDVGAGKMQWYAFHKEPGGGVDAPNGKKERLLKIFGGWCDNVIDLILATDEDAILRRDIYDRSPIFTWGKGLVTLLGDSVHAMQPNMGQGGCMAIEDSYQLALELEKSWRQSVESGTPIDVTTSLKK